MRLHHFGCVLICLCFVALTEGAEMRTWTAAAGGFTVEAELVELKAGDVVRLKTKDGRTIDVPLAQLSAADRAFVRPAPAATTAMPAKPSAALNRVLKAADRCRMPDDAIAILRVFHDESNTAAEERAYVAGRLAELKDLSAKKMVRLNKAWVTEEEADVVRQKADTLMRQGLQLLKLRQFDAFQRKFNEAAALEPELVRAEFLMALVMTLGRDESRALAAFQKCVVRDPENIAVLNNAALVAAAKGDYNAALSNWRRALDYRPDQRVIQNVGRFLRRCTALNLTVPKNVVDGLALPYAELTASGKFEPESKEVGWLLMLIEESDLDIALDKDKSKPEQKSPAPDPNDDGTVVGSGTGFVFHPGYVLTNAHVAIDDAAFEIQTPDGTRHKATRVAADKDRDLAILKCEPLTAPPLVLHDAIVPRGTDVMLFGYPEMLVLGTSLKATRGSISSLPDPQIKSKYLYDAVSNAGNSGGPLCDAGANVVAVHSSGVNTASRYAGGVPSTQALEFVKKNLPEFRPSAPSAARFEWPQVDERASASTMLIWIRKKDAEPETASIGGDVIELPYCLLCQGREGSRVGCRLCSGAGVDLELRSVKRAVAAATATRSGANAPDSSAPAASGTNSTSANPSAGSRPVERPFTGEPPPSATGNPIDLMAGLDPDQHYSPGSWRRRGNSILGGGVDYARFAVGQPPPTEYDLELTIRQVKQASQGATQLWIGMISSTGRPFHVILGDTYVGHTIDIGAWGGSTLPSMGFQKQTTIRILLRRDRFVVLINGRPTYGRRLDPDRAIARRSFQMSSDDAKRLSIGSAGNGADWEISGMKLIPLN